MTSDTKKWLIGTGVVLAGLLGGLLSAQIQGVNVDRERAAGRVTPSAVGAGPTA